MTSIRCVNVIHEDGKAVALTVQDKIREKRPDFLFTKIFTFILDLKTNKEYIIQDRDLRRASTSDVEKTSGEGRG